jgi:hypothetical protein
MVAGPNYAVNNFTLVLIMEFCIEFEEESLSLRVKCMLKTFSIKFSRRTDSKIKFPNFFYSVGCLCFSLRYSKQRQLFPYTAVRDCSLQQGRTVLSVI